VKALFRIRDYRLLWTGQAVSNFGDALTNLALLLTAQRLTGSTAAVATTAIAVALPTLLFGMVAGAYVDRWNRKRVMVVSDLFRTSFVLLFLLVTTPDMMWLLYTVAFVQAALGTFFNPAKSALVPRIVPPDQLLSANSVSQMTQIVFGLIGTAVAGLIAATMETLALAYILDASTFIISLAAISLIQTDGASQRTDIAETHILRDIRAGIQTALGSRVLVGVLVGAAILMLGIGAVNVLLVPFIVEDLAVSEAWFAAFEAAQVVPMVIAATLVAALASRIAPTRIITITLGGLGVMLAFMAAVTAPWHMIIILFTVGWMITPLQASVSTLVQTEVEDEVRGRTGAALNTVLTGSQVASMALAGVAATALGTRSVFVLAGVIAVIASAATVVLFKGISLQGAGAQPEPAPEAA
jgi:MFS family permease